MQQTLITAAKYAKLRGLNRSTISRQVESGAIPTHNGLIDPIEADAARGTNLDQKRRQQAKRHKERRAAMQQQPAAVPLVSAVSDDGALLEVFRLVVGPAEVLKFTKVARALGCSKEQAWALGSWHATAVGLALPEIPLEGVEEPTNADWERLLGRWSSTKAGNLYCKADAAARGAE